jgi:hypothetical protein
VIFDCGEKSSFAISIGYSGVPCSLSFRCPLIWQVVTFREVVLSSCAFGSRCCNILRIMNVFIVEEL